MTNIYYFSSPYYNPLHLKRDNLKSPYTMLQINILNSKFTVPKKVSSTTILQQRKLHETQRSAYRVSRYSKGNFDSRKLASISGKARDRRKVTQSHLRLTQSKRIGGFEKSNCSLHEDPYPRLLSIKWPPGRSVRLGTQVETQIGGSCRERTTRVHFRNTGRRRAVYPALQNCSFAVCIGGRKSTMRRDRARSITDSIDSAVKRENESGTRSHTRYVASAVNFPRGRARQIDLRVDDVSGAKATVSRPRFGQLSVRHHPTVLDPSR